VETRDGLWTRYSVVFPAERVVRSAVDRRTSGIPPAVRVQRVENGQLAVLVVDDNHMVRTVLRRYLEKQGHQVMEAVDGGVALEILQDRVFDRVMVDIDMPGTTGVEFFRRLDTVNPDMRNRTVFMTGGFQEPETEEFIQGTGRPQIQKPFDLEEISVILTH
jgi:CheY-like chemotaxis protein